MEPTPAQLRQTLREHHAVTETPLYVGVFLMFGMIGCLIAMLPNEPWGWLAGLASCLFSGINALVWAWMFSRRAWWLAIVGVSLPFLAGRFYFAPLWKLGVFDVGFDADPVQKRIVLVVMGIVLLASGFTLIIYYLVRRERQAARFKSELDVAQRIHASLVPPIALRTPAFEVYGVSAASSEMGGDLIDAVERDGALDLVLADVSGHGVGAGVVMAMVKAAFRTHLSRDRAPPLYEIVTLLNRVVTDLTTPEMFVTLAAVRLDADGRGAEAALAGHLPMFHRVAADGRVARVDNAHLPLGVDGAESFTSQRFTLSRGDTLVLYTDGLVEAARPGEQFGLDRLAAEVARLGGRPSREVATGLLDSARAFGDSKDDQSVLVVRVA